ncbi:MAG: hypothetical protein ACOYK6_07640 [Chthoniobacterales bacterium]
MNKQILFFFILLGLSMTSFALEQGEDGLPHLIWKSVNTDPSFPNTVSSADIAVSTTDDFMALVTDSQANKSLYFFDHNTETWTQKKMPPYVTARKLEFGLGKFYLFGTIHWIWEYLYFGESSDDGTHWKSPSFWFGTYYDHVAFSETRGIAIDDVGNVLTGKNRRTHSHATSGDELMGLSRWGSSGVQINHFKAEDILLYCSRTASNTGDNVVEKFVVLEKQSEKTEHYFLKTDDFLTEKPLLSANGITWNPIKNPLNLMTVLTGQDFDSDQFLIYDHTVFHGNSAGFQSAPFTSVAAFSKDDFSTISKEDAPSFEVVDCLYTNGYFVVAGTVIYQGSEKTFAAYCNDPGATPSQPLCLFIADVFSNDSEDKIIAMKANHEGILAITDKGHSFFAALPQSTSPSSNPINEIYNSLRGKLKVIDRLPIPKPVLPKIPHIGMLQNQ